MKPAELQTKLKTLRLGGMLHTLELRRSQAEDQRLGHVEFLALLLDDEIDRRQSKMLALRLHRARFEEEKTLEEFDLSFNPQTPAEQLRNLATCGFVERRESVLLCGPVGVGKTHAAQAWDTLPAAPATRCSSPRPVHCCVILPADAPTAAGTAAASLSAERCAHPR
jgi:DNA replication protein DnaC